MVSVELDVEKTIVQVAFDGHSTSMRNDGVSHWVTMESFAHLSMVFAVDLADLADLAHWVRAVKYSLAIETLAYYHRLWAIWAGFVKLEKDLWKLPAGEEVVSALLLDGKVVDSVQV